MVVLASAAIHDEDVVAVASELNVRGRRIRVLSHFYEEEFAKVPLMELNAAWFLFDVAEIHSPRAYGVVKRAVETLFAAALLLLASPLVPVIADRHQAERRSVPCCSGRSASARTGSPSA